MSRKRTHSDGAWKHAKQVCRLNVRQVEMARALGMNPKKLPRLRPGPQQRWKLPVGAFIEECYWKRFGGPGKHGRKEIGPPARRPSAGNQGVDLPEPAHDWESQASELVCYLTNLADDLQQWLAYGEIAPDVLPQVRGELEEIVKALASGASIAEVPAISLPPRHSQYDPSNESDEEQACDDDQIPF